ncbi:hypothetical protein HGP28_12735 [Vibrio sp. SM6]|uniref:Transmembrane protein n=1 Tax=Vibrio agarilyticus TaxID=2726741 RepID=A0A7X8TSF9_9VIBR|nr:hypothetical protein [Vibrio agarilyticus]NLS13757.1 hypothetical protein [Vibrio agarilyticus]
MAQVYLFVHLFFGFIVIWLSYYRFDPLANLPFELRVMVEALNLIIGVLWGNWGWDNFQALKQQTRPLILTWVSMFFWFCVLTVVTTFGYYAVSFQFQFADQAIILNSFSFVFSCNAMIASFLIRYELRRKVPNMHRQT